MPRHVTARMPEEATGAVAGGAALGTATVEAATGMAMGQATGQAETHTMDRAPLVLGQLRFTHWPGAAAREWCATDLMLGMFDRAERWSVKLPPVVYRDAQLEEFESELAYHGAIMEAIS